MSELVLPPARGFVRDIYAIRLAVASKPADLDFGPERVGELPIAMLTDYLGMPQDFGCPNATRWGTRGSIWLGTFRPMEPLYRSATWETFNDRYESVWTRLFAHKIAYTDVSSWG